MVDGASNRSDALFLVLSIYIYKKLFLHSFVANPTISTLYSWYISHDIMYDVSDRTQCIMQRRRLIGR
jgi:hypothetical protein